MVKKNDIETERKVFAYFKEAIGNSRVVALGECAHFVREFWQLREQLFEFLYEELGFNFFAMEFGFAEGFHLEKWINGEGESDKLSKYSEAAAKWGALNTMRWLRAYNEKNNNKIRFAGIDIPEAGGTIIPALLPLHEYITKVDKPLESRISALIETSTKFSDLSSIKSVARWKTISETAQYKLFADLNKVQLRFKFMESDYVQLSSQKEFDIAYRLLETAITTAAVIASIADNGLPLDMSIREKFMADSVLWHLKHSDPGTRIVIFAHNNHIQKTAVQYGDYRVCYPMGFYLNQFLGKDYAAFGLTTTDNSIPDMNLTNDSPVGFKVIQKEIGKPIAGSYESYVAGKGYKDNLAFTDFQKAGDKISCFRSQGAYISTASIKETFDGMFSVPQISFDETVGF